MYAVKAAGVLNLNIFKLLKKKISIKYNFENIFH